MSAKGTVIHWFRKGLRVHDNPALIKACDIVRETPEKLVLRPIFILDPGILQWLNVGANRWRFLQQSLVQLDANLQKINTRLYVVRGNPIDVFPRIFEEWKVTTLTYESDIEPYATKRDSQVRKQARNAKVAVVEEMSHTIYNPERLLQKNLGKPIMRFQSFLSAVESMRVCEALECPKPMPDDTRPKMDKNEMMDSSCYGLPTVDELVKDKSALGPNKFPGGETEALARLESVLSRTSFICSFEKPNTSPNSLDPSTTVLSPYLKFGCLSARLFYHKLRNILRENPKHTKPPVCLMSQLMWREFYYAAAAAEPKFDRMVGNSLCYQIPWQKNDDHLEAWAHGRTGYPFIDAIMRQLRQEGWIHHLARHAVACFLTRGDLFISWEEGQKVFEELLLDADWALNAGNWMWLSASAFFHQYFRVYSPVSFGKKTDPEGDYIRKYVPELKLYPAKAIYEPWTVSASNQEKFGCVIGKDYPERIVNHDEVRKRNLTWMADAYKKNKLAREESETNLSCSEGAKRKAGGTSRANVSKKFKK